MDSQQDSVTSKGVKFTPMEVGGESIELVNSKDLHKVLGVGRAHAHWIADRVQGLGLVSGRDYHEVSRGGDVRVWKSVLLTADSALKIAVAHQSFRGVNTPAKQELLRQREVLQEALLDARPDLRQALRYERQPGLSAVEKARLMGCSENDRISIVAELLRLGLTSDAAE